MLKSIFGRIVLMVYIAYAIAAYLYYISTLISH